MAEPFDKQDEMLQASVQLPSGAVVGPTVTSAFCGVMAELSLFVNLAIDSPLGAIALGLGLIALVVVPASLTRWRPAEVMPLRRPRRTGQLLRAGGRIYRRHWRVLVLLGLTSLVIVAVFEGLRVLLVQVLGEDSVALFGTSHASQGLYGSIVAVGSQVGVAIVTAAIVTYMRELERGRTLSALRSYRLMAPRFWRAVGVHLLARYLALLLALTVIGIPYAIKKYVDWQLVQQEVLFEDRSLRDALRASSRTVRGHWWHTAATVAVLLLLGLVAGPALGIVLVFTPLPPGAVNLFGSVVYALVIPFLAVSVTLLYLDLSARQRAAA